MAVTTHQHRIAQEHAQAQTTAAPAWDAPVGVWRMLAQQRDAPKLPKGLDAIWDAAIGLFVPLIPRRGRYLRRAERILAKEKEVSGLPDAALREMAEELRSIFRLGRETEAHVDQALALVREQARRTLGLHPYREQVAAALAMIDGCLAEMATGEGKTLVATMPAVIAGWRGRGCHVMTVNDYLARRDATGLRPLYAACGLNVAWVEGQMPPLERRQAYHADVTYGTNKEVAADYLRDKILLGRQRGLTEALVAKIHHGGMGGVDRLVMRGLDTAIIDEADSLLIDEAVTPLIISTEAPNEEQTQAFQQAAKLAKHLVQGEHYTVNLRFRDIDLTRAGRRRVSELCADLPGVWQSPRMREELIVQAVTARELFLKGQQYVVKDGKVVIVDESTGRLMPDRSWRHGLHQAVEAKEGLEVTPPKDTMARISFQRFFRMYRRLSGMTGTAWESRHELWQVYKLPTVRIPTHKPCIRVQHPDRVFGTADAKWKAVVEEIKRIHKLGRPVLVGTRSVEASEKLSAMLNAEALKHEVLNAVRHEEEATIVAQAGQPGRITVATNMAGRGTDIKLGKGVAELGGLHVIATERHESGRIDRQLYGRAGRQGDPGSAIAFVSLEDELIRKHAGRVGRQAARVAGEREIHSKRLARLFRHAQARAQRMAQRQRRNVLKHDEWLDENLGFAGREYG
ncbi:MAG: preprotein translocase subunit SecA [Phycisphaeraceae bacterium]